MNYEEFKDYIISNIKENLSDEYKDKEITLKEYRKNNGTIQDGISIISEEKDKIIFPIIYLNNLYKEGITNTEAEAALKSVVEIIEKNVPEKGFIQDNIIDNIKTGNFNNIEDRIFPCLINKEYNEEFLKNTPYTVLNDLAVIYKIDVSENKTKEATITINDSLINILHMSKEKLNEIAIKNLENEDFEFVSMQEMLSKLMAFPVPQEEIPNDVIPMYIITNKERLLGSVEILNPKMIDKIAEKFNSDFIVLPSSVHELIAIPYDDTMTMSELKSLVEEVNRNAVSSQDKLSDNTYGYLLNEREFLLMDDFLEKHKEKEEIEKE